MVLNKGCVHTIRSYNQYSVDLAAHGWFVAAIGEEYSNADFGDRRLNKRCHKVVQDMLKHPECSIPIKVRSLASSAEIGELDRKDPVQRRGNRSMELLEGKMNRALDLLWISTKRQQIAKLAKEDARRLKPRATSAKPGLRRALISLYH